MNKNNKNQTESKKEMTNIHLSLVKLTILPGMIEEESKNIKFKN